MQTNKQKQFRAPIDHSTYWGLITKLYKDANYNKGIMSYVMSKGHSLLEKTYSINSHENLNVIETGAGDGIHFQFVNQSKIKSYMMLDNSETFINSAIDEYSSNPKCSFKLADAYCNYAEDNFYDRLIACHVLEHLDKPHIYLERWSKIVKSGGVISILLPCDPGILWRLGRTTGIKTKFYKAGIDYNYWMAREHINSIYNLMSMIRFYFPSRTEHWWPLKRIASPDLNLFYCVHAYL